MKKISYLLLLACGLIAVLGIRASWSDDQPMERQLISHEALDGDPGAQLLYGLAYLHGRNGLRKDPGKAVYWLRRAARAGNAYAQLTLGDCHAKGLGVAKDPAHAIAWWRKAARQGNAEAQLRLGMAYLEGNGVKADPEQARHWITKAAEQGNSDAQYQLGKMYHEGRAVPRHEETAKSWLSRAAARAHSGAVDLLAIIEGIVDSGTKTYQESVEVLREKAEKGDPQAAYELGLRYESGAWDVNRDDEKALYWITRAAEEGDRVAMKTLANIYHHGDLGQKPDPEKAARWEKKASESPSSETAH